MRALDVAAVLWIVLWLVLAIFVGREVRNLRELSDTVVTAGVAIEDTGGLLRTLGSVPLVGARVSEVAGRVEEAGRSAEVSGRASRESTRNLSILLALSIALIPTLPLLGLYLPLRLTFTREARALRRTLSRRPDDPLLIEFLARRAVATFSYDRLLSVSEHPYRDLEQGRYAELANLELARLGLRRSAPAAGGRGITDSRS